MTSPRTGLRSPAEADPPAWDNTDALLAIASLHGDDDPDDDPDDGPDDELPAVPDEPTRSGAPMPSVPRARDHRSAPAVPSGATRRRPPPGPWRASGGRLSSRTDAEGDRDG